MLKINNIFLSLLSLVLFCSIIIPNNQNDTYRKLVINGDTVYVYPTLFNNVLSLKKKVPDGVWIQFYAKNPEKKALIFIIKDGRLNGEMIGFHLNEQKMVYGNFYHGKKDGEWTWWNNSGLIEAHETWKNGVKNGLWVFYDLNGKRTQMGYYKNGKSEGKWTYYNKDGTTMHIAYYKKGVEQDKPNANDKKAKADARNYQNQ